VQAVYGTAYPQLQASHVIQDPPSSEGQRTLRVGFVSTHFRHHSICKLFCGVISELAAMTAVAGGRTENGGYRRPAFDVTVFSGVKETEEDDMTRSLKRSLGRDNYVTVGMPLVQNRYLVQEKALDVLIFLDIGMEPATKAWAGARLAPVQMAVWGHPSTTGMASVDYFISSERFHTDKWGLSSRARAGAEPTAAGASGAYDYFSEQLVQLPGLNFYFERSALPASLQPEAGGNSDIDAAIMSNRRSIQAHAEALVGDAGTSASVLMPLVVARAAGKTLILCPQHLPKFHPRYDGVLESILGSTTTVDSTSLFRHLKSLPLLPQKCPDRAFSDPSPLINLTPSLHASHIHTHTHTHTHSCPSSYRDSRCARRVVGADPPPREATLVATDTGRQVGIRGEQHALVRQWQQRQRWTDHVVSAHTNLHFTSLFLTRSVSRRPSASCVSTPSTPPTSSHTSLFTRHTLHTLPHQPPRQGFPGLLRMSTSRCWHWAM
jgi:hypothetical protein